jgi:hypothetical protein
MKKMICKPHDRTTMLPTVAVKRGSVLTPCRPLTPMKVIPSRKTKPTPPAVRRRTMRPTS